MTPKLIFCSKCNKHVKTKEFVKCFLCARIYDIECVKISASRFHNTEMERKNAWKCPDGCPTSEQQKPCISKMPKQTTAAVAAVSSTAEDSKSTNARNGGESGFESPVISHAKPPKSLVPPAFPSGASKSADKTFNVASSDETQGGFLSEVTLRQILQSELLSLKTQNDSVSSHLKVIDDKFSAFQEAKQFVNIQFEEMKEKLNEKTNIIEALEKKNTTLETTVLDLSNRLNLTEQHLREGNIEINGIPEHRTENLSKTVLQLARTVKCDIADADILHVTRVAKMNKDNKTPRSVIVKLRSPRLRDTLLAAVSKFNKDNNKDKLSSEHLGIGGSRASVYVAEHLTPANKHLHAATRKKAKELGYEFVWVRNGGIRIRKDATSPAYLIRNLDCLNNLT